MRLTKSSRFRVVLTISPACGPNTYQIRDFTLPMSLAGGNKLIFSSGARFQPIDFLNATDLNRVFQNPVR